jgi:two-component system, LytTR family, sensor kinase
MIKSLSTKTKIVFIYLAWWCVWVADHVLVLHQIGFSWQTAFTDSLITQGVVALAGYVINTSMHSYQPSARNSVYIIVWSLALTTLCVLLQRWLLVQILQDETYLIFLENTLVVRGAFAWLMIMLVAVLTWFWVYVTEKQEIEKRKQDSERLAREAELSSLRLQLQPHFLFNSLNSISALISTQPEQARKMIYQLSDFLRGTVRRDDKQLVSLKEELDNLQLYLEIEKVRFGHRLVASLHNDEKSLSMKIPPLLLQPVVENAIKFGLYDNVGQVEISVRATTVNDALLLEIKNPFDPTTSQPRKGTGFGLSSVQRRLYLLYAQNDLLHTQQENNVFTTTIKIPQAS